MSTVSNPTVRLRVPSPVIRRIGPGDLHHVMRAQAEIPSEDARDPMGEREMAIALDTGLVQGLCLSAPDRHILMAWQRQGADAAICLLHREGPANTFYRDLRLVWERAQDELREWGVKRVVVGVSPKHPRYYTLIRLYGRVGFKPSVQILGKEL